MLSKKETEIWRESYDLHDRYRDQLTTPEKWMEFAEAVNDMVNRHGADPMAYHMGVFLMEMLGEAYRDGHRPEPVQASFFDEEAYS